MTLLDRLDAVPALTGRVQPAGKLAELQQRNQAPQVTPAAFLIPAGLRGGTADAGSGLFRQSIERMTSVVLYHRGAGDADGGKATVQLEPLIEDVVAAVAGWGPDDAVGVYRLMSGALTAFQAGLAIYQLDFLLDDQLRITPS